jgi:hypothetical protein
MRKLLLGLALVTLVTGYVGAAAAADREVTVTPIEFTVPTPLTFGPLGFPVACQVGNLNPAAWAISNFLLPPEEYKLAFDPLATCSTCPVGFRVTTVRIYLQTGAACTITMAANVEEAVYAGAGCPAPGPVVCGSSLYTVNVPSAGLWNIGIPITCDCLATGRDYLLGIQFVSASCTPDLITDAGPGQLCLNWNNYGTGWYDLVGAFPTWPGQLKILADAECCTPPVPAEERSWGAVKQLYDE